ncbi:uncharacterized protein LOC128135786 isoform X2 [Harpia harpyja]|uniref:uncharacterized protein LOC128135786 isoform X2 n=1 Tax=Harpia harpyja TaxID=202280 RepID=UPI0022B1E274|nr:uncharacterized protein LOC128135786 isoform X2 [Harpia harpyja]
MWQAGSFSPCLPPAAARCQRGHPGHLQLSRCWRAQGWARQGRGGGGGYRTRARVCCPCVNPWRGHSSNAGLGHPCAIPPGDIPAPNLFLNTFGTRDWELLLFRCSLDGHSPATRIVFCKDGVEEHSMKAQQGQLSYIMLRNVTLGSEGTYTCGYQHRNRNNWVRSSALSTPQNLTFTGSRSSSQEGTLTAASVSPAPQTQIIHNFSICNMMGLVAISLILPTAASYCAMKKGSKGAEMGKTKCIPAPGRYLLPALWAQEASL